MEGLLDEKRNKELIILADLEKKENPAVEKGMDDHLQKKLKEQAIYLSSQEMSS